MVADHDFFNIQKDILFDWHYYDPVDLRESERTWNIALYQEDIPNPFIIDPTLIWRTYFSDLYLPADINLDQVIDVLDIVLISNQVLGFVNFTALQKHQSDLQPDFNINVLDILIVVNVIIS